MRTTLDLEESLLHEAMKLLGTTTKRETVRQALRGTRGSEAPGAAPSKIGADEALPYLRTSG
jgi:Arc/MetJ family transcription regulator